MNNNFYVTSDTGRGRVDPEDGKSKTKKNAPVGQNFRKMLDKDQEGASADTEITDLDENGGSTAERSGEIAGEQVFSLFGRPKVKPVPTRFPVAQSQPNILHQKPMISKQVADNEETGTYAAIEEADEEASPLLNSKELVADNPAIQKNTNTPPPVVVKKEARSVYSPGPQDEGIVKANDVKETPAAVFAKIKKDPMPMRSTLADASDDAAKAAPPLVFKGRKENEGNPFPHEEIDMSRLGPQGAPPVVGIENVAVAAADKPIPVSPKDLQLLIDQLLKQMTVVTTGDKTETTVIIRQPPIFDGAQVVITSFGSAKGELNLTFGNLRPDAQVVIQQQQHTLLSALEQKGYYVHIFTATTIDAQPVVLAEGQASRDRQQQGGRGEERGGREGRDREERQG